jgi:ATP-binding cassette subfamily B protein
MRKKYYLKSVSLSNYENELLEWINGKIVIDSYNLENDFDAKLEKEGNMYFDSALTAEKYGSSISPFSHLIQHSCIVIISIMALLFVNLGITTIAIYSAFILYSKKFADPVGDLSNSFTEFSNSYASFKKINEFLNNDYSDFNYGNEEILDLSILKTNKLSFSYDGEKKILNDIDFTSFKNGMTAIVGHTGCGKTTLISLLLRLYSNYDGNIYANECEYRNLNSKFLKEISYVSQEPWIFSGTILENLTYGNSNYDINLVYEITKKIGLDSSIKKLKDGYNEIIDSSSNKLSNGQLQMISVSRAMIQNRKFLIMDEPTSNIDIYSELKIKEAIEDLRKDKTTIIIAHRLSTIYKADSIYVIDDGKVLECGTHKELLENDKLYKKLVLSHFITEEKI